MNESTPPVGSTAVSPDEQVAQLVVAYREYMRVQRRLAPITVHNSAGVVRRFLAGRDDKADLATLNIAEVHRIVLREAGRLQSIVAQPATSGQTPGPGRPTPPRPVRPLAAC